MKKVLFFSNSDHHFYMHLLPIALASIEAGYNVSLLTNIANYKEQISQYGINVIPISMSRNRINPLLELFTLFKVIKIIVKEKPNILHNFTLKPILYGSIASLFANNKMKIINTFLGMGFVFINQTILYSIIRKIVCSILSLISKMHKLYYIVQNSDDRKLLIDYSIAQNSNISIQCSVGIEGKNFPELPELKGKIIFALVARMLVDKGIYEFIAAAKILKEKNLEAEFWLIGAPDEENKSSLTLSELNNLNLENYVQYLGFQEDISKIWKKAHVAVLPSYREGLSRSLLEAGAYGRAIITTDAPGGRELIRNKVNGLLVKPKDITELANSMELLILNPTLRKSFARQIRKDILDNYEAQNIAKKMIKFYEND